MRWKDKQRNTGKLISARCSHCYVGSLCLGYGYGVQQPDVDMTTIIHEK